jgi:hypothetical protein
MPRAPVVLWMAALCMALLLVRLWGQGRQQHQQHQLLLRHHQSVAVPSGGMLRWLSEVSLPSSGYFAILQLKPLWRYTFCSDVVYGLL